MVERQPASGLRFKCNTTITISANLWVETFDAVFLTGNVASWYWTMSILNMQVVCCHAVNQWCSQTEVYVVGIEYVIKADCVSVSHILGDNCSTGEDNRIKSHYFHLWHTQTSSWHSEWGDREGFSFTYYLSNLAFWHSINPYRIDPLIPLGFQCQ